jgi:hypothetical protein
VLCEWLSRLSYTQFEIRSRPPVVWTLALIKNIKRVDNVMSRAVDHWFDNAIGGYVTNFFVDRVESYSQAERYFLHIQKYLLSTFVPARSELRSNPLLLAEFCGQNKIRPLPTLLILA